jgi:hypothetical protein
MPFSPKHGSQKNGSHRRRSLAKPALHKGSSYPEFPCSTSGKNVSKGNAAYERGVSHVETRKAGDPSNPISAIAPGKSVLIQSMHSNIVDPVRGDVLKERVELEYDLVMLRCEPPKHPIRLLLLDPYLRVCVEGIRLFSLLALHKCIYRKKRKKKSPRLESASAKELSDLKLSGHSDSDSPGKLEKDFIMNVWYLTMCKFQ